MDPYAHGGAAGPVRRTFSSLATQGGLTVTLRPIKQNPQLAGIIVKGYSYSDVFLEDLPVAQLDVARSEDFSILDRITSGPPADPSAIYGTANAMPTMNQPGMDPEALAGHLNPAFSQTASGPFTPGMNMGMERQMEIPTQQYGRDRGDFGQAGNIDQAMQQHSGQTLQSPAFAAGPSGVRTSLPIQSAQKALPGMYSRMAVSHHGGAPGSENLRRVYHRHLSSIPHDYEEEEQGFASSGIGSNGDARESHMFLPHVTTKTDSNILEPYSDLHHSEIPTTSNSIHIDTQDREEENQLNDISITSRAVLPHLRSDKSEGSSWNVGSNPAALSASAKNHLSSTQPQLGLSDSSVPYDVAAANTLNQGIGFQSRGVDGNNMNQVSSDVTRRRVSEFDDSNRATLNSVGNGNMVIERSADYNTITSRQESTDGVSEQLLPLTAAEQKLNEVQQEVSRLNLMQTPKERQFLGKLPNSVENGRHRLGSMSGMPSNNVENTDFVTKTAYQDSTTSNTLVAENQSPPTAAQRHVTEIRQNLNQVELSRDSESRVSPHMNGYAPQQQRFVDYRQPVIVEDPVTTATGSDQNNPMPLDIARSQFKSSSSNIGENRNHEISSSIPGYLSAEEHTLQIDPQTDTESTSNNISFQQASSGQENISQLGTSSNFGMKALNVIQNGIKLLSGYVDDDSNDSGSHDDQTFSDADGTIDNMNQQDKTSYQNIPIVQSGSEIKLDSTSSQYGKSSLYDSDGIEDNNAARKFDGICLHNSTHCTCGMLDERLKPTEECLFVINENASPMICARRPCNAKLVCACAPGATAICRRTEIKTILVPAAVNHHVSSEPNVVFCKREQLDHGIGVLTPIL